ncbi:MAG: PAS domain S-box protein [Planctomycetes bacterium]|nr:PAS domain S-box protein [Planctomycetota bacterium]
MNKGRPTYQELKKRLAIAEPIVEALKHLEVDAVVGKEKLTFLLLKEVGEELQHSEAGFRAMFELPGVGMVQADTPAFRFTKVNRTFYEMLGYSPEELMNKTFISLTYLRDRQRAMKEFARVLRGKTDSWSHEKRCVRKDGSVVWVAVSGTALRDDTGQVVRVMAMVTDLTARKQAEQILRDKALLKKGKPMRPRKPARNPRFKKR